MNEIISANEIPRMVSQHIHTQMVRFIITGSSLIFEPIQEPIGENDFYKELDNLFADIRADKKPGDAVERFLNHKYAQMEQGCW